MHYRCQQHSSTGIVQVRAIGKGHGKIPSIANVMNAYINTHTSKDQTTIKAAPDRGSTSVSAASTSLEEPDLEAV